MNHTFSGYALMVYSEGVFQLKKESKSLKDDTHHHMEGTMGYSVHMQRFSNVDFSSLQCTRIQKILFEDVVHVRNTTILIQGMPCHSSTISR
jgi:hypothetical protein